MGKTRIADVMVKTVPVCIKIVISSSLILSLIFVYQHIKSSSYSRYYTEACNEWRVHLRGFAPEQHSCEETSQQWRAVGDTACDLTDPVIKPTTFRAYGNVSNHYVNRSLNIRLFQVAKIGFCQEANAMMITSLMLLRT